MLEPLGYCNRTDVLSQLIVWVGLHILIQDGQLELAHKWYVLSYQEIFTAAFFNTGN